MQEHGLKRGNRFLYFPRPLTQSLRGLLDEFRDELLKYGLWWLKAGHRFVFAGGDLVGTVITLQNVAASVVYAFWRLTHLTKHLSTVNWAEFLQESEILLKNPKGLFVENQIDANFQVFF